MIQWALITSPCSSKLASISQWWVRERIAGKAACGTGLQRGADFEDDVDG
jgi:hypothetical protein